MGWWAVCDGVVTTAAGVWININGSSVAASSQQLSTGTNPVSGIFTLSPNTAKSIVEGQAIAINTDGNMVASNVTQTTFTFVIRK
ncbi:MAG: hypothetical protein OK436_06670 [Thaumarchaeota archaeon]|nr:hypothetical protein [Nitrososphaerota archaeon]